MAGFKPAEKFIPVMEPSLEGNEEAYLVDAFRSTWISSSGKYIGLFEKAFCDFAGVDHGIAVATGTAALHLALAAIGVGKGDEVLVPDFTFPATANAVIYTGATPVLVDIEDHTFTIDWRELERKITRNTKAIIPVHILGRPCEMDAILEIADKYNLFVIEDAAEAHGAEYRGKPLGSIGDIGCFSFFGNKIITTGEGGMCVTGDKALIERMTILRDHGMSPGKKYWNEMVGFNYRITNLQAAIGLAQMEQIETFIERKRQIAMHYSELLNPVSGILYQDDATWREGVCWLYYFLLDHHHAEYRDTIMQRLREQRIDTRPVFYPLHTMPPYRSNDSFPVTDKISKAGIFLPSSVKVTMEEQEYICQTIQHVINSLTGPLPESPAL